jgi:hypothetical protein
MLSIFLATVIVHPWMWDLELCNENRKKVNLVLQFELLEKQILS